MTRQQRRKLERDKNKNSNQIEPHMFGMYYKDNTEEGFNLVVSDLDKDGPEILKILLEFFDEVKRCYRRQIQVVSNGERGYSKGIGPVTSSVLHNLKIGIENWNKIQNITSRSFGLTYNHKLDFSDKFFVETLFYIMYGIYFLVQQGIIVDDNYNGFIFMKKMESNQGTITYV